MAPLADAWVLIVRSPGNCEAGVEVTGGFAERGEGSRSDSKLSWFGAGRFPVAFSMNWGKHRDRNVPPSVCGFRLCLGKNGVGNLFQIRSHQWSLIVHSLAVREVFGQGES